MGTSRQKAECKCCVGGVHNGVTESMEEMDFQRSLAGAAQLGDVGRMRSLIARGAAVDGDADSGYTPLHYAARHGHVQACLLLVQVFSVTVSVFLFLHVFCLWFSSFRLSVTLEVEVWLLVTENEMAVNCGLAIRSPTFGGSQNLDNRI